MDRTIRCWAMRRLPNGELPNEFAARRVVSDVLGVPVKRYEGVAAKRNKMVDAVIIAPDGEMPLEVVSDTLAVYASFWAALDAIGHSIDLPAGSQSWVVQLSHWVKIGKLALGLRVLLAGLQPKPYFESDRDYPEILRRSGITGILPVESNKPRISLMSDGFSSWENPGDLNDFVREVFAVATDVPEKLFAHGEGGGHAFIWATISSKWSVMRTSRHDDSPFPAEHLALPPGVTDVWVGVSLVGHEALRYNEHDGWTRTGWYFANEIADAMPLELD